MKKIEMVEYCGEMVPAELCTIDREGGADDFVGCGACFNDPYQPAACEGCVVSRIFQEYARLSNQIAQPDSADARKKPNIQKEYQEHRKVIEGAKTKELLNELRRRGVKAGCL